MQLDNYESRKFHGIVSLMGGTQSGSPAQHFGKQMRKERLAHGWSLPELSARTGINAGHLSRIETGKRPPTEHVALAIDAAFPERKGYFLDYYEESRTWAPPGFRDWPELESRARRLSVWTPGVIDGLAQAEDYARSLLATLPGATAEAIAGRLRSRMERQRRVLAREDPPTVRCIVDHAALYRLVGSPATMAGQMRHLAEAAALPHVTIQVLPAVAHPATQSGFMVTDDAAYAEHVIGGFAYTETETVTALQRLFDTLRDECYRVSESLAIIRRAGELWTGESPVTQEPTAASASKSPPASRSRCATPPTATARR
jgi:transcriptional regulator with XRE-family HTH domain